LTPCCGLEVQKPTQALQSVKGPGNTFDLIPKWSRTLPSLIYFSWDIYRECLGGFLHLKPTAECQISTLIFNWLEVQKPTQALKSVKGPENTFDWNAKLARTLPSLIYCSWDIYRLPPKFKISKLIFDTLLWA
jgi:hypothetical protein